MHDHHTCPGRSLRRLAGQLELFGENAGLVRRSIFVGGKTLSTATGQRKILPCRPPEQATQLSTPVSVPAHNVSKLSAAPQTTGRQTAAGKPAGTILSFNRVAHRAPIFSRKPQRVDRPGKSPQKPSAGSATSPLQLARTLRST